MARPTGRRAARGWPIGEASSVQGPLRLRRRLHGELRAEDAAAALEEGDGLRLAAERHVASHRALIQSLGEVVDLEPAQVAGEGAFGIDAALPHPSDAFDGVEHTPAQALPR